MHAPGKEGDERNYHAHVLLTMRLTDGESFGPKERQWDKTQELEVWRAKWAEHQNRTFEKLGLLSVWTIGALRPRGSTASRSRS